MVDRDDVERYRDGAGWFSNEARKDLDRVLDLVQTLEPHEIRRELLAMLPDIADYYGDALAATAAEWYEDIRDAAGDYRAVLGDQVKQDMIDGTVRYAMRYVYEGEFESARHILAGAMQRWVQYAGRSTIARNVQLDPSKPRFARVPQGPVTCSWCTMLASRGWVYHSRKTAGEVASDYHDHCECEIVPSWDAGEAHLDGYDPDAMYARYLEARGSLKGEGYLSIDDSMVAKRMAELRPEQYTDGRWPPLPKGTSADGSLALADYERYRRLAALRREQLGEMATSQFRVPPESPATPPDRWPVDLPELRSKEWNHILYGDSKTGDTARREAETHGGHSNGFGWISDRSEFPASWNDEMILDAIESVLDGSTAAGRYDSEYAGVKIRVVVGLGDLGTRVVTAFPLLR